MKKSLEKIFFKYKNYKTEINLSEDEKKDLVELTLIVREKYEKETKKMKYEKIKVRELFWNTNYDLVFEYLKKDFEVEEEEYDYYKKIFNIIKKKGEKETNGFLGIRNYESDKDVSYYPFNSVINYSVSLTSYEEIANYLIKKETIEKIKKEEIAAIFLNEFSWNPDDEYKEELEDKLNERIEELEKDQDEFEESKTTFPKERKTISINELLDIEEKDSYVFGKTIREVVKYAEYGLVKEELKELIDDEYELKFICDKEKIIKLLEEKYFNFIIKIKNSQKNISFEYSRFDLEKKYLKGSNYENIFAGINCVYKGEQILELVDSKITDKFCEPNRYIAKLFLTYVYDEIIDLKENWKNEKRIVDNINNYLNVKKNIENILKFDKLTKENIMLLDYELIKSMSYILENYILDNYYDFKNYNEITND